MRMETVSDDIGSYGYRIGPRVGRTVSSAVLIRQNDRVSTGAEVLLLLVMLVGVVGTVIPVLPGLFLVWAAGIFWVWADGGGTARITVGVLLTVLLVLGTVAKYALPARSSRAAGAPRRTLVLAVLGAVVGFFVIPVVGMFVGFVVVLYVEELRRLGDRRVAWRSSMAALKAIGLGVLIEIATAMLIVALWVVAALTIG